MSNLEQDLTNYANEVFTKGDLNAGWKLVSEVLGLITLVFVAITGCSSQKSGSEDPAERSKAYGDCLTRQTKTGEDCSKYQSP